MEKITIREKNGETKVITRMETIRYVKGGIYQYAKLGLDEFGVVLHIEFSPHWVKSEDIPKLEGTYDEIMTTLREFSDREPTVYLINGVFPRYFEDDKIEEDINTSKAILTKQLEDICFGFFKDHIAPILKKNKWKVSHSYMYYVPIIVREVEDGWDNVRGEDDEYYIEYISMMFLKELGLSEGVQMTDEMHVGINKFKNLMGYIQADRIEELDLYYENI